ncbi:MAG TPA: hypothetical protein VFH36_19150 [Acidimicrobiales bacterium]|nr:hypothetical protein [Acidimicrobiales bacterium]
MTTDHPPGRATPTGDADDHRERLERLRQRRASPAPRSAGEGDGQDRRPRRTHAAAGSRILAAGASVGAALVMVAAMAGPTQPATPASPSDAPAAPVVVVRRPGEPADPTTGRAAPAVGRTDAPPVTTSQAS